MAIYKTKWFGKWLLKNNFGDAALLTAVEELNEGLSGANLGGDIYKKRIAVGNQGKRGGVRTLIAFRKDGNVFFVYGFAKNKQSNINVKELKALKLLAKNLFGYSRKELSIAVIAGELLEVNESG